MSWAACHSRYARRLRSSKIAAAQGGVPKVQEPRVCMGGSVDGRANVTPSNERTSMPPSPAQQGMHAHTYTRCEARSTVQSTVGDCMLRLHAYSVTVLLSTQTAYAQCTWKPAVTDAEVMTWERAQVPSFQAHVGYHQSHVLHVCMAKSGQGLLHTCSPLGHCRASGIQTARAQSGCLSVLPSQQCPVPCRAAVHAS